MRGFISFGRNSDVYDFSIASSRGWRTHTSLLASHETPELLDLWSISGEAVHVLRRYRRLDMRSRLGPAERSDVPPVRVPVSAADCRAGKTYSWQSLYTVCSGVREALEARPRRIGWRRRVGEPVSVQNDLVIVSLSNDCGERTGIGSILLGRCYRLYRQPRVFCLDRDTHSPNPIRSLRAIYSRMTGSSDDACSPTGKTTTHLFCTTCSSTLASPIIHSSISGS